MENGNGGGGNIGAGDAAVLALLADTNRAGRGGWGGEGYGCGGPYATPSSIQHTIGCARDQLGQQANMQGEVANQQAILQAIASVGAGVVQSEARAVDIIRGIDLNTLRESADLSRQINSAKFDISSQLAACCCETQKGFLEQALKAQECCCETQKTVLEDGAKTRELIASQALRAAESQNNINATVAPIVAAIQATCGGHHHGPR